MKKAARTQSIFPLQPSRVYRITNKSDVPFSYLTTNSEAKLPDKRRHALSNRICFVFKTNSAIARRTNFNRTPSVPLKLEVIFLQICWRADLPSALGMKMILYNLDRTFFAVSQENSVGRRLEVVEPTF